MNIPLLTARDIDCRVGMVKQNGCTLLLYKNARCDMRILDEVFGITGWKRMHTIVNDNLFCTVSIWDGEKQQWIDKQDVGVESRTEKEKGEASDSFKRACVNIGVGRELYTAPFIWVKLSQDEVESKNGSYKLRNGVKFYVDHIQYDDKRNIMELVIRDGKGRIRFSEGMPDIKPSITPEEKSVNNADVPQKKGGFNPLSVEITRLQTNIVDIMKSGLFDEKMISEVRQEYAAINKDMSGEPRRMHLQNLLDRINQAKQTIEAKEAEGADAAFDDPQIDIF